MDVIVSDHIGFNLDTDALHFGRVTSPGWAGRELVISHDNEKPTRVDISVFGDISNWVYLNKSSFVLFSMLLIC